MCLFRILKKRLAMRQFTVLLIGVVLMGCQKKESSQLEAGVYRGAFEAQDNETIPFTFEVISPTLVKLHNAEEVIDVDEIEYKNDSVYMHIPVFESVISATVDKDKMTGFYIKPNSGKKVPFSATLGTDRFIADGPSLVDVTGNWKTVFSPDSEEDRYIAKGIFKQEGGHVTGTFRTTTGDYRYLEGVMDGNQLKLSTFDGSHAFLFVASTTDSTMSGMFYSGNHWKEPFVAKRNENYELPDEDSLTFLKEGYDKVDFSFKDTNGQMVSLNDATFKDKVVVVQLMGSWCPNCLDETRYLSEYYKGHKAKGVEFVALAFEYAKTEELALKAIKRLQERIGVEYPILLAQFGSSDKSKAQEKLPMLNHVWSYPTTIFIDKKGQVRKIHTGFNGPATGEKYEEFKVNFEAFVNTLLRE